MMSVVVVLLVGVPLNYYYYEEENKMMMNKVDPNTERFALWAQNRTDSHKYLRNWAPASDQAGYIR